MGKIQEAKEDLIDLFTNPNHRVYQNNGRSQISLNDVFSAIQLKVLLEDRHVHWNVDHALKELYKEDFLSRESIEIYNKPRSFYYKSDLKDIEMSLKEKIKLTTQYLDPLITSKCGNQAEGLFEQFFVRNGFEILDRDSNEIGDYKWDKNNKDLDFIIEKDDQRYGIEIKNSFPYIGKEEFDLKMYEICSHLHLIPCAILRNISDKWAAELKNFGGTVITFKKKLYSSDENILVQSLRRSMNLPVEIYSVLPLNVKRNFLEQHLERIK